MTSFFSSISKGIQLVQQKVTEDANFLNEKISRSAVEAFDPGKAYGILWEKAENIQFCRGCQVKFPPLLISKHHCRSCAGIFCDNCCPLINVEENPKYFSTLIPQYEEVSHMSSIRVCDGCCRGECPGMPIKEEIRTQLEAMTSNDENLLLKNLVNKVSGSFGLTDASEGLPNQLKVSYGSFYGEDGKPKKAVNRPLPASGYFEIHNKSKQIFCIKVLIQGVDVKFEMPRPSYKAVPPNESMYSFFDPDRGSIEILIMHGNPNPIEEHRAINYNTTAPGMRADRISKSAKVGLFCKIAHYSCSSVGKNVLLKYHGDGVIEPRSGNSMGRIGFFSRLQGRRFAPQKLDYSTNIDDVKLEFEIAAEVTRFYKQPQSGSGSSGGNSRSSGKSGRIEKVPSDDVDQSVASTNPKKRVSKI